MIYKNKFGEVDILNEELYFGPNTSINTTNKSTIGIELSGGADSTILCVLLANTIKSKNINMVIQPVNHYNVEVHFDSDKAPPILEYIQKLFPTVIINPLIVHNFKIEKNKTKTDYTKPYMQSLIQNKILSTRVSASTMGPPLHVQETFGEIFRIDDAYKTQNALTNAETPNHQLNIKYSPFKNVDKRFVVQCYRDLNIYDLFEMTISCVNKTAPNCGTCWWCKERKWAVDLI